MTMKRALIVTVGTGTRPDVNIVRPLVKTVRDSRPDFLVLAVTHESHKYGEKIVEELGLGEDSFNIVTLKDLDDFQFVFRDLNRVFRDLAAKGYCQEEVQVDFTSGTKAMSSGAVCAAIYNQCNSLKYISGERKNGVVVDGSERFRTVEPAEIYTLRDIRFAAEMIASLRFSTAEQILSGLNLRPIPAEEAQEAGNLRIAAQVYNSWDLFDHAEALKKARKVQWDLPQARRYQPSEEGLAFLIHLGSVSEPRRDGALLPDLFNNAVRRGMEGKYDDALARLYRAAELFAQNLLRECYGIESSAVDLDLVPDSLRGRLERNADRDGVVRIGLVLDYEVLGALDHPAGRLFLSNSRLQSGLTQRNSSILAHGLTPVPEKLFRNLRSDVSTLFQVQQPDFEDRASAVQFPWLKEATHA